MLHSDRGSQFRSRKFVQALDRHRIAGSIGRVGAAGDNAAMESFFNLLRKNVLDRRQWAPARNCGSRS
jgi:transposase InsO family protein